MHGYRHRKGSRPVAAFFPRSGAVGVRKRVRQGMPVPAEHRRRPAAGGVGGRGGGPSEAVVSRVFIPDTVRAQGRVHRQDANPRLASAAAIAARTGQRLASPRWRSPPGHINGGRADRGQDRSTARRWGGGEAAGRWGWCGTVVLGACAENSPRMLLVLVSSGRASRTSIRSSGPARPECWSPTWCRAHRRADR